MEEINHTPGIPVVRSIVEDNKTTGLTRWDEFTAIVNVQLSSNRSK